MRQGGTTCFNPQKPDVCKSFPVQDAGKCPDFHSIISGAGEPLKCNSDYIPSVVGYSDYYYIFEYMAISAATSGAWEFLYYDNLECKGEPMKVVKGNDVKDNCLKFSENWCMLSRRSRFGTRIIRCRCVRRGGENCHGRLWILKCYMIYREKH